ncbi:MAG: hypothetical protein M1834_008568 [Cirrosporium novae-zelandiae]|nr:MAG: hypothetical protein M1834_008568 [Cirrosporium novae-zelandiae]
MVIPHDAGDQPVLPKNTTSSSLDLDPIITNRYYPLTRYLVNGSDSLAIERFKIRELCEGWSCHRDACEWEKFRAMFADDAYVFTTWSGPKHIDDFIKVSTKGFKDGDWIMHRANGVTCDVTTEGPATGQRGVGKMKVTITQRFTLPANDGDGDAVVDIECDATFFYFVYRDPKYNNDWKVKYYKSIYYKDKLIPIDPFKLPKINRTELAKYPEASSSCRSSWYPVRANNISLAYGQAYAGHPILMDLPERSGKPKDKLYEACVSWLKGEDVEKLLGFPR